MAITILTKQYKLAWKDDLTIVLKSDIEGSVAVGNANTFESNTQAEIDDKIRELELTE